MSKSGVKPARTPRALAKTLGLVEPTAEQTQIIAHPLTPLLVVAGAGSGKTATMTQRVIYLIATGQLAPSQVLGLTFARKAAGELAQRVTAGLDRLAAQGLLKNAAESGAPTITTYDAFAGTIVREYGVYLGVDPDFTLITDATSWQIVSGLVEASADPLPSDSSDTVIKQVISLDQALNNNLLTLESARADMQELRDRFAAFSGVYGLSKFKDSAEKMDFRVQTLALVDKYRQIKAEKNLLTFSDQTKLAYKILNSAHTKDVANSLRRRYRGVLLDEFQDTSALQMCLLAKIFNNSGVTAVGDPNQAIYGWRGASAAALAEFRARFSAADPDANASAEAPKPATILPLSTAWRNDVRILQAANVASSPLRCRKPQAGDSQMSQVPVKELQARPEAAQGNVFGAYTSDSLTQAELVADFLQERRRCQPECSLAVLSRKRDEFPPLAQELEKRNIPYEMPGIGGLLALPEVADVRALLQVALDPHRSDWLLRLLTKAGIEAADLAALYAYAKKLPRCAESSAAESSADSPVLAEALAAVAAQVDAHGSDPAAVTIAGVSPQGLRLFDHLARQLRRARAALKLPLPDLITVAQQILDLDIEVQLRPDTRLGARGLAALRALAQQFLTDAVEPSLEVFLQWLDFAQAQERGLAEPEVEPRPGTVQLLTIHAAKGLEWDHVAVIGLREKTFPKYGSKFREDLSVEDNAWLTRTDEFPHTLRLDAAALPPFQLDQYEASDANKEKIKTALSEYKQALGRHLVQEERRLAYVAFTRARHDLLLVGSHFAGTNKTDCHMSRFLAELRRRDLVTAYGAGFIDNTEVKNSYAELQEQAYWPVQTKDLPAADERFCLRRAQTLVAQQVRQAVADLNGADSEWADKNFADAQLKTWWEESQLLLAEQREVGSALPQVPLPLHLAATKLEQLRADPQEFALDLRRPIPQAPSPGAHLGTVFHAALAQRLTRRAALMPLEAAGAPDPLTPTDRAQVERWIRTAVNLPVLQDYVLYDTEVERELTVAGVTLRCRIDAVFRHVSAPSAQPGAWLLVDWKTGINSVPVDQLSTYVHVWARSQNVPTSCVRALYAYVGAGKGKIEEITAAQLLSLADIAAALAVGGSSV